ncbi:MAG: hypothetical protein KAI73_11795, partial [Rhodospirillaceae bacterium]|nr:hypothetical protein [Rhodospirillaceae bacterium]
MGLFSKIIGGVGGFLLGGPAGAAAGLGIATSLESKKTGQAAIDAAAQAAIGGEQALTEEARRQTGVVGEEFQPFIAPGAEASNQLLRLIQGDRAAFARDPGAEFIREEALGAVDRGASAAGLLGSGTRFKALQDRAAGLASTEFGNFFNRLLAASGQGRGAAAQKTAFTTGLSRDIGQSLSEQGQIRASSFLGR